MAIDRPHQIVTVTGDARTVKRQRLLKEAEGEKDIASLIKWDQKAKR
jgi:hypothetical protein